MSLATFFEDLDTSYQSPQNRDPIWTLGLEKNENEKQILDWLKGEIGFLTQRNQERYQEIKKNLQLFKNIQYQVQDLSRSTVERRETKSASMQKISVNHLGDVTKSRVARLVKYKPGIVFLPANDEYQDKISAKTTKSLLDHIWYIQNFENVVVPEGALAKSVMGEAYLWIDWDPDLGDKHPDNPKNGKRVPLLDANGKPEKNENGDTIFLDEEVMTGDVRYDVVLTTDVLLHAVNRLADVEYCFRRRVMPTAAARLKWPKAGKSIQVDETARVYDFEQQELIQYGNSTVVWEFWHKNIKALPKGRKITFTKDGILENIEHPFSHGGMPFERLTDLEYPGELHGVSFYRNVRALQGVYNNLTNFIVRNQHMVSHPKWMIPAGSVRLDSLGNDITMVQYKGGQPPVLAQANTTPSEVYNFREQIKNELGQLAGVFQVSRGEVPPGIKAGVALQFLSEQESERHNEDVLKFNEWIKQVAKKTIAVCGDYYDESDKRMIRVIGKNNQWTTAFFDASNLSKDYDIRVQNASALPESKAARMQTLLDLNQQFPNEVPPSMVLDMLDMAQSDKFIDVATAAVRTAQAENELIAQGKDVQVMEYEDHLKHWQNHAVMVQELSYKTMTPENVQEKMKLHIMAHEMLLVQRAKVNPALMQQLQAMPSFPMFFVPEELVEKDPSPDHPPTEPPAPPPAPPGGPMAPEEQLPIAMAGQPTIEQMMPSVAEQTYPEASAVEPSQAI